MHKDKQAKILSVESTFDYALLDSGEGEKLERFGKYVLSRPDPQALWSKKLSLAEWKKADGHFSRDGGKSTENEEGKNGWSLKSNVPTKWEISFGGLKFWIKPTAFKHTGLFPEQEENWGWMREKVQSSKFKVQSNGQDSDSTLKVSKDNSGIEVLNLFGYTGGATLACAQAGAKVVHIDSSKSAIAWARENAEISSLKSAPIRWIVEDARLFVEREIKRGRKYDAIIMDPPAFGHGANDELWKIEEDFLPLVQNCLKLLFDKPLFFLINGYSAGYSAIAYENVLLPLVEKFGGEIEIGELTIEEEKTCPVPRHGKEKESQSRLLPAGIFARWFAN